MNGITALVELSAQTTLSRAQEKPAPLPRFQQPNHSLPPAALPKDSLEVQIEAFETKFRDLEHSIEWHDPRFRLGCLSILSRRERTDEELFVLDYRLRQLARELESIAQTVALCSRLAKLHPAVRAIVSREIGLWQASGLPIEEWLDHQSRFRKR